MRALTETERRILALIEPDATALGLDIVRIRVGGGRRPTLQIMAERPDGTMTVEDCARLSRRISPVLEASDPIDGAYALEVSSPGIDRPLTRPGDFGRWAGHEARVEIGVPVDGRRRFHGDILSEKDGVVSMRLKDGANADIPLDAMTKAHLVLTDALVATAQARGLAAAGDDEEFDDVEFEDDEDADDLEDDLDDDEDEDEDDIGFDDDDFDDEDDEDADEDED